MSQRQLFEFQRGKGTHLDADAEAAAYYGRSAGGVTVRRHTPGSVRRTVYLREPLVLMQPRQKGRLPPDRTDHAYLRFRDRIGHSFHGWVKKAHVGAKARRKEATRCLRKRRKA